MDKQWKCMIYMINEAQQSNRYWMSQSVLFLSNKKLKVNNKFNYIIIRLIIDNVNNKFNNWMQIK